MAGVGFRGLRPKNSGQDGRAGGGGGRCDGLHARGFWRNSGELEAVKPWQARTFTVAELAPSMTLKSYWVQKP